MVQRRPGAVQQPVRHMGQQHCHASQPPQMTPPGGRQPHQKQHDSHTVQHPKVNEAAREHPGRAHTHQKRTGNNLSPAPPKAHPGQALVPCNGLTPARAKKKHAHDRGALQGPERVRAKILRPPSKVAQVKTEMEDRHPHHRHTAPCVHPVPTNRVSDLNMQSVRSSHGAK